jgi:hypothetical protein
MLKKTIVTITFLFAGTITQAKTKETMDQRYPTVMAGKLLDLQPPTPVSGYPGFAYTIQIDDLIYTAWCEGIIGLFNSKPCTNNFIVGDPVEIRISRWARPLTHDAADKDKKLWILVSKDEKVSPDFRLETLNIVSIKRAEARR